LASLGRGVQLYVYDHHPASEEQKKLEDNAEEFVHKDVGSACTIMVQQIIDYNTKHPNDTVQLSLNESTVS
jgi:nanoRNase/pAp phosphatase (c-di-AMP/oligoRNAs hydrolase)